VTGWTGQNVARSVIQSQDLELVSAVARKSAGQDAGEVLGLDKTGFSVSATVKEALSGDVDVYIDYTSAEAVKRNVLEALNAGTNVVIGSSGLTADDFKDIENAAKEAKLNVICCGNFSITAALAKRFSLMAAKHLPHWEIVDYASAEKIDVPSGTTRELAEELEQVRENKIIRPLTQIHGPKEARGAQIAGTPVHSIRLPSYKIAFETIFGLPNERLTIRHDSGSGAEPYVDGTLLAVRKISSVKGLVRGMDNLLFGEL
ncbi:MAG TPA: 4-hydroxy-tetrahydrodipicolinate reductase, partial [Candidatus Melainabacteria bacterium]|nr:4-hydroxy-tetrahydrodipicolinate reductase [Candidatus Melainabacteria bacterium]